MVAVGIDGALGRTDHRTNVGIPTYTPLQTLPRVATVQGPDQNQWITKKLVGCLDAGQFFITGVPFADYEKAALSAAKVAKLVPESDFANLTTQMHTVAKAAA